MCLQSKTAKSRAYVRKHVWRMSARKQEREKVAELSHALAENADSWAVRHVADMSIVDMYNNDVGKRFVK